MDDLPFPVRETVRIWLRFQMQTRPTTIISTTKQTWIMADPEAELSKVCCFVSVCVCVCSRVSGIICPKC